MEITNQQLAQNNIFVQQRIPEQNRQKKTVFLSQTKHEQNMTTIRLMM